MADVLKISLSFSRRALLNILNTVPPFQLTKQQEVPLKYGIILLIKNYEKTWFGVI
jgi:hypothetical protein